MAVFSALMCSSIMAADFFVVPTVTYRRLFVLVMLAHDRDVGTDLGAPAVQRLAARVMRSSARQATRAHYETQPLA